MRSHNAAFTNYSPFLPLFLFSSSTSHKRTNPNICVRYLTKRKLTEKINNRLNLSKRGTQRECSRQSMCLDIVKIENQQHNRLTVKHIDDDLHRQRRHVLSNRMH